MGNRPLVGALLAHVGSIEGAVGPATPTADQNRPNMVHGMRRSEICFCHVMILQFARASDHDRVIIAASDTFLTY